MQGTQDNATYAELIVEPNPELVVKGHSGDISVRPGDHSRIRVTAHGGNRERQFGDGPVEARKSGNRVTVELRPHGGGLGADLVIEVPPGCAVKASSIDGDVAVHGTQGAVELHSVDGDLEVDGAVGSAKITTVGGDVQAEYLEGELVVQTTNGDVRVQRSILARFNVHSVNGDVSIETALSHGEHYFAKTVNGDILLSVPPDSAATVQMRSLHGELTSALPTEIINRSRRNWQGRINGGGAIVELETQNGDVRLAASDHLFFPEGGSGSRAAQAAAERPDVPGMTSKPEAPDLQDVPPLPDIPSILDLPPASDGEAEGSQTPDHAEARPDYRRTDSIAILGELERGEITVEEAMTRLDSLR